MATNVSDSDTATRGASKNTRARSTNSNRSFSDRASALTSNPVALGAAAAAAGVIAGIAATMGRKAAVQAVSAMSGDWFDALKAEHKATILLFDKLQATSDAQTSKRTTLLMQLKHALSKHAFEEENVIYPQLRDEGEKEEADHLAHDHGYVKQYLYDLENMPRNDPRWLSKVADFRRDLEKHVREEEDRIFPALRVRLSQEENAKVTAAMSREGYKLA